jgi:AsmA protein
MARPTRTLLFAAIGFAGLLVLVAGGLLLLVHANVGKARLEAAASGALGMEVSVGGRLGIGLFPGMLVTLEDVHIRNRGSDLASAKQATIAIGLLPLLRNEVQIEKIALQHATISIEKDRDGRFNFEQPEAAAATLPALDWPNLSLSHGTLVYADQRSAGGFEAADCRLEMHRLRLSSGRRSNFIKGLSFTAELACGEVRNEGFTVSDLKLSAAAKNGVFDLSPVTTRIFGTLGSGSIQADASGAVPHYRIQYSLPQFPIEEFFKAMARQQVAAGRMDFSANLSMQGTGREMRQTVKGAVSLRGKNLTLRGRDLDGTLSRFESSQNFNLVDVGAFFFAGPLGLVVTKGYDFASVLQGTGSSSEIHTLVSDWKVERGVAQAQDVAMATKQNRVALRGGLDFVNGRFDNVTMALIDAKGCAKVRQRISGTFQNPLVEQPSLLASLTGPARRLLQRGSEFLGGRCEVFYAGSVAAPR